MKKILILTISCIINWGVLAQFKEEPVGDPGPETPLLNTQMIINNSIIYCDATKKELCDLSIILTRDNNKIDKELVIVLNEFRGEKDDVRSVHGRDSDYLNYEKGRINLEEMLEKPSTMADLKSVSVISNPVNDFEMGYRLLLYFDKNSIEKKINFSHTAKVGK